MNKLLVRGHSIQDHSLPSVAEVVLEPEEERAEHSTASQRVQDKVVRQRVECLGQFKEDACYACLMLHCLVPDKIASRVELPGQKPNCLSEISLFSTT